MNKINLIGRVVKKPELKMMTSGKEVVEFSLAVNRSFKNSNGDYDTDFFNCRAYGNLAKTISKFTEKGDKLGIVGSVYNNNYEDKEGIKRIFTYIAVQELDFVSQAPKKKEEETPKEEVKETQPDPFEEFANNIEIDDDMLPFM